MFDHQTPTRADLTGRKLGARSLQPVPDRDRRQRRLAPERRPKPDRASRKRRFAGCLRVAFAALGRHATNRLLASRAFLLPFALLALLAPACGPDAKPPEPCDGPDFDVVIRAAHGELPSDTLIVLIYGSGREEYRLSENGTPEVLFCSPADTEGEPLEAGAPDPAQGGASGASGASSTGGGGASAASGVASLRCELWTQGPATLEITGRGYPDLREELKLQRETCTVEAELELTRGDAGS
jgi:hypothetical protein